MYIFNRTRQARSSRMLEAIAGGIEAADKVKQITGLDLWVWAVRFGAPVGTITWSTRIESQTDIKIAMEKTIADAAYMDLVQGLDEHFEGQTVDSLGRLVSGTPREEPSQLYTVTMAKMTAGRYREAIEFAIGMQEFMEAELGRPTAFLTSEYGGFSDVAWLMGHDSMDEVEAASQWVATSEEYHERVHAATGLFIDGSGETRLIERLN